MNLHANDLYDLQRVLNKLSLSLENVSIQPDVLDSWRLVVERGIGEIDDAKREEEAADERADNAEEESGGLQETVDALTAEIAKLRSEKTV